MPAVPLGLVLGGFWIQTPIKSVFRLGGGVPKAKGRWDILLLPGLFSWETLNDLPLISSQLMLIFS